MATINEHIDGAVKDFEKAYTHLKSEFAKLQIGRASAALVEGILVDSYGSAQPMKSVANISIPDAKTINIQPWDRSMIAAIEKAIRDANVGLNPNNNGAMVILNIPPLTEERRKDLAKVVGKLAEEAKIGVRTARQAVHNKFKHMKDEGEITEDDLRLGEKKLQERVDEYNKKIEESAKQKEQDIMTV